ncbi:MAG: RNA polymerase [Candidatus Nephthysia bennettiae]|uniref:Sigma-70 family RNA polymerase sigma factor n=1 Tax=Candidatus Nephthysia bennettiae TaxID=3127016 RepID=A0A934K7N2_9BACT|nr:sigma-70 family RNA polymerase sigma factor [Candidatus Dormibacteraeota bacterium]MBJ7612099.1 sigma-70 family RNA polymerase sigma factor [Candidatus Dormibacteraeota bacterium]PZR86711.1 MAG: RNA polymerase [Candidatus Dormibacteraeota bacterium]
MGKGSATVEDRSPDEAQTVERARRGDASAYGELVRRYTEMAFRTAYLVTGSAADAEDAAQDAFVKAYRALPRFRPGGSFRAWLLRIVGNEARNRRRSASRRVSMELRVAQGLRVVGSAPSPEDAAEAEEERQVLLGALNRMAAEDRQVISCRYLLQLSVEETAAALDLAPGTVKSRLSRALIRLRELMEPVHG